MDLFAEHMLLTDAREVAQCKDAHLSDFCKSKENCRRQLLLKSFGSSEVLSAGSPAMCCDVCSPHPLCNTTTDIFRHVAMRR